jgi:hypothetical protein
VVAGVRLDPHLDVDEAVRADHEIPKSVETNPGQSHEHTRVPVAKRRVLEDYSHESCEE